MTQTDVSAGRPRLRTTVNERPYEPARLDLYRMMVRMRAFEERAEKLAMRGVTTGASHLGTGMEAVAAGAGAAMRDDDYTFCTYRSHNHTLARGVPMEGVWAELMGRPSGICGGKGGSMHLTSVEHGHLGSYAIVGAHLPIAAGAAWSAQVRGSGQVAVCFFGDGATNIGAFHEALNIAAVWTLPVVFVCENNHYMEYTPIGSVTAVEHPAADRAGAYGLDPVLLDGNDVEVVHEQMAAALAQARAGEGPSLVEAVTYRHGGHSRNDPGDYRPANEVDSWLERDPIPAYRERLVGDGVEPATLDQIDAGARQEVDDAAGRAQASPLHDPAVVETDVWGDGGATWRN